VASATRSASPTLSATPSPSPTASTADPVLSSEGWGPLRILKPVPADQSLVAWNSRPCGGEPTDFGEWQALHAGVFVENDGQRTDPIATITVLDPSVRTAHGLHVGSTLAEAKALGAVLVSHEDGFGQGLQGWAIRGSVGELAMWVGDGVVKILVVEKRGLKQPHFRWEGICG
jgi:hypothetical protein